MRETLIEVAREKSNERRMDPAVGVDAADGAQTIAVSDRRGGGGGAVGGAGAGAGAETRGVGGRGGDRRRRRRPGAAKGGPARAPGPTHGRALFVLGFARLARRR